MAAPNMFDPFFADIVAIFPRMHGRPM